MHWCILSLVVVAVVAVLLRFLVRKISSNHNVVAHVDEFVGNLGSGVFIAELGVIGSTYGSFSPALLLSGFVHLFIKFNYFKHSGGYGNPLAFVASYYRNGRKIHFSMFFAASIIVTQFVGLYCGQKLAKFIWAFEDHSHVDAILVTCRTALSSTHPLTYAALSEGLGVFTGVIIVDFATPHVLKEATAAALTMTLYFFFTHISGMFMNPIIATALSFRCKGHQSDWHHVAVYWMAPAVGMILAWEFHVGSKKIMHKRDKSE